MSSETSKLRARKGRMTPAQLKQRRVLELDAERREIQQLNKRVAEMTPPRGSVTKSAVRQFNELPISSRTIDALTAAKFTHLTDIQRMSLPHALAGRDILGAARTGSGKTLAFLIPIVETLYKLQWNVLTDGVGAIVITPTRELAVQIFDVLRVVGAKHSLSAGLLIGGKTLADEQTHIGNMAILVCTPGRLLQHMEQSVALNTSNVRLLVLDEADRILDCGFSNTMTNILQTLPRPSSAADVSSSDHPSSMAVTPRQTLLFSATQTKSVRDLAKLSLHDAEYISVHEGDIIQTPYKLEQYYMIIDAHAKFDLLYSFIKTHLKKKLIIFVSTCKQSRWMYEMYRRLRPGIPLLHIHGHMAQIKRMSIYYEYVNKNSAILFATDIAARGLDFPHVDWVIQMDCPESIHTYIHRVGRTARYRNQGKSLLMLTSTESIPMLTLLTNAQMNIKQVKPNNLSLISIINQFKSFCAADNDVKYLTQKTFISYLKCIYNSSNKNIFNIKNINLNLLADAMGLSSIPNLSSLNINNKSLKNMPHALKDLLLNSTSNKKRKKDDERGMSAVDRLLQRQNTTVLSEERMKMRAAHDSDDDDQDILTVRRVDHELDEDDGKDYSTANAIVQSASKKRRTREIVTALDESELPVRMEENANFVDSLHETVRAHDDSDRQREQVRVRSMHAAAKERLKARDIAKRPNPRGDEGVAVLAVHSDDEDGADDDDHENDQDNQTSGEDNEEEERDDRDDEDDDDDNDEDDHDEDDHGDTDNDNIIVSDEKDAAEEKSFSINDRLKLNGGAINSAALDKLSLKEQEQLALQILGL